MWLSTSQVEESTREAKNVVVGLQGFLRYLGSTTN
jgi:hypothetical protein